MSGAFPQFPEHDGAKYAPHSEGAAAMVCVDALYLGERVELWKGKEKVSPKCALVFASGERNGAGELVTVSREFTYSVGDKAGLRIFLQQWRGKPYESEAEARQKVKLDKMVGAPAIVTVAHKPTQSGRVYANIVSVGPLLKGMEPPKVEGYERGEWWAKRIAEYAAGVAQYRERQQFSQAPHGDDFDDFAGGGDDDDLGF